MALVSTGQITITDNNDARPITAYITASNGLQQIFTKDEDTSSYIPNWVNVPNILTVKVFAGKSGSAEDVFATTPGSLTGKKWSTDLSTSIGAAQTFTVNTNIPEGGVPVTYYFEADYTDPITGLTNHIIAQIGLSMIKTGTNAVFVLTRGKTSIEEANGAVKNVAVVCCDLVRAGGIDTSGVSYRFFESDNTAINTLQNTQFGLKTTLAGVTPTGVASDIGVNLPTGTAYSTYNTIVISELAITDMAVFRVEVKDSLGTLYQSYFTVYDVSDPYDTKLFSTAGDKLQNGIGSTNIYPLVWNGSTPVTDFTGWSFKWYFYDGAAPGNKAGFIDTSRGYVATTGRAITANTAGAGAMFSYNGAAITFAAGDMIKCITPGGTPYYFEVASGTTTINLTVRTAINSTFLNTPWPTSAITTSQFVGGKLFVCRGSGATAGTVTTNGTSGATYATAAAITVTGDDIDFKGNIVCEVTRP